MSTEQEIRDLIILHTQRLNYLKQQQAVTGLHTDPKILIEIQQIEAQLAPLSEQLAAFTAPDQPAFPQAPLVHIHNWGRPPRFPDEALAVVDWAGPGKFEQKADGNRGVPAPAVWQAELLPALKALPGRVEADSLVRLEGKCALSTGFAFGHIFNAKDRYQLEVAQYVPDKGHAEYWFSGARPPTGQTAPRFASRVIAGEPGAEAGPNAQDGVIVVNGLIGKSLAGVLADVGRYLDQAEAFSRLLTTEEPAPGVKGLLLLEATAATQTQRPLEGWEAAALARTSRQQVTEFKQQITPARLHLFLAAPLGLAVFLGHFWNNLHIPLQCYEEDRTATVYTPSCLIHLS